MNARGMPKLTAAERRRGMRLGHVQGTLWSIGNGLTTGPLIIYLALDLGARSSEIGLILAVPAFASLLRIVAPDVLRSLGGLRDGAIKILTAAYLVVAGIPLLAAAGLLHGHVWWLIALLSVHQLLESIGMVAVWSLLGKLAPARVRGRYLAARQRLQIAVLVPTLLGGGLFADYWQRHYSGVGVLPVWGYAVPIGIGVVALLLSVIPLRGMPKLEDETPTAAPRAAQPVVPLLRNGAFLRLVVAGCWISFFNGFTQTAQNVYPRLILGLGISDLAMMRIVMQFGQIALSPVVGRLSDRYGNRPVLAVSQAIVALGPLFYLIASPDHPYRMAGAWVAWSAFVGLNVCLPALLIKLAPPRQSAAYIALYFALTGVAYAAGTLTGASVLEKAAYDLYRIWNFDLDNYHYMFYVGWVTRSLGVLLILAIPELGARRLGELFFKPKPQEPERQSPWD